MLQDIEDLLHPNSRQIKELPNADFASRHILSLPLYPEMKEEDLEDVIAAVSNTIKKYSKKAAI